MSVNKKLDAAKEAIIKLTKRFDLLERGMWDHHRAIMTLQDVAGIVMQGRIPDFAPGSYCEHLVEYIQNPENPERSRIEAGRLLMRSMRVI